MGAGAVPTHPDQVTVEIRAQALDADGMQILGERGVIRQFDSRHGRLAQYFWPAHRQAKAVVMLLHGHGANIHFEYLKFNGPGKPKTYEGSWVQTLNAAGYSVTGTDLPGSGRSDGLFGYCDDFHKDYVGTILQAAEIVASSDVPGFASLPVFLLGTSLGGCIAVHAALQRPRAFAGALLLAPMLSLEKAAKSGMNRYLRPLGRLLNVVAPTLAIVATNKNTMFPMIQQDWDTHLSTYHYKTRVRTAQEFLAACEQVMVSASKAAFPFLIVHSSRDTQTDPDGSRQFHEEAPSQDKTLRIIDDMWHVLVKEPGNQQLLSDCIAWMDARAPGAMAATTGKENGSL